MNKTLFNQWVHHDLKKPEVDAYERAELIQKYLDENEMSQYQFARKFNIPQTTIQAWLTILKLEEDEYKKYEARGKTFSQIYKIARVPKLKQYAGVSSLEEDIISICTRLKCKRTLQRTKLENMPELLDQLEKSISCCKFRLEAIKKSEEVVVIK